MNNYSLHNKGDYFVQWKDKKNSTKFEFAQFWVKALGTTLSSLIGIRNGIGVSFPHESFVKLFAITISKESEFFYRDKFKIPYKFPIWMHIRTIREK